MLVVVERLSFCVGGGFLGFEVIILYGFSYGMWFGDILIG